MKSFSIVLSVSILFFVGLLVTRFCRAEAPAADKASDPSTCIFTHKLNDTSEIQVLYSELPTESLKGVFSKTKPKGGFGYYRAEVHSQRTPLAVVIWSDFIVLEHKDAALKEPACLDVACQNQQFVALFYNVGQIWLYYHDWSGGGTTSGVVLLQASDWCLSPVEQPYDPISLKAKLKTCADGKWQVSILNASGGQTRDTTYQQVGRNWEFDLIKTVDK